MKYSNSAAQTRSISSITMVRQRPERLCTVLCNSPRIDLGHNQANSVVGQADHCNGPTVEIEAVFFNSVTKNHAVLWHVGDDFHLIAGRCVGFLADQKVVVRVNTAGGNRNDLGAVFHVKEGQALTVASDPS